MRARHRLGWPFDRGEKQHRGNESHAHKKDRNSPVDEVQFGQGHPPADDRATADGAAQSQKKHCPTMVSPLGIRLRAD